MKNTVNILHNTATFVFPRFVGGDHLAEVGIGTVDELGVEERIGFDMDGVEVKFTIRQKKTLGEFTGAEAC